MLFYKIRFLSRAKKDLNRIAIYMKEYNANKIIQKIHSDIDKLKYMPRIHKTLIYNKDKAGEYRRMISGKYSVIYKIEENKIIILRIFNQRENYLNHKKFILKEKSQKYIITK